MGALILMQMATPSLRFPLHAGGTEWARGLVPLAKLGGTYGGGQFVNSGRAGRYSQESATACRIVRLCNGCDYSN